MCAVPALAVVAEAMVAFVLPDALLEKFGGDSIENWSQLAGHTDRTAADRQADHDINTEHTEQQSEESAIRRGRTPLLLPETRIRHGRPGNCMANYPCSIP